jgi:hypothetical protein
MDQKSLGQSIEIAQCLNIAGAGSKGPACGAHGKSNSFLLRPISLSGLGKHLSSGPQIYQKRYILRALLK